MIPCPNCRHPMPGVLLVEDGVACPLCRFRLPEYKVRGWRVVAVWTLLGTISICALVLLWYGALALWSLT